VDFKAKGHAELVQNLVKEVPRALDRPNLTLDHATRLHAVIEKGVRDFDEILKLMDGSEAEETYRQAGESLARTWQHLSDVAEDKVGFLRDRNQRPLQDIDDSVPLEFDDIDGTERTDSDRNQ
jgi:hypothetical protein